MSGAWPLSLPMGGTVPGLQDERGPNQGREVAKDPCFFLSSVLSSEQPLALGMSWLKTPVTTARDPEMNQRRRKPEKTETTVSQCPTEGPQ